MTQYEVKDGVRTYKFEGSKLASSSSETPDKDRWVEFELYKTNNNEVYIVSRVGYSRIYHSEGCDVVSRNRLTPVDPIELDPSKYVPCSKCSPNFMDVRGVFPEVPRYHAQVCNTSDQVVAHLKKRDANDYEYLTKVARELLSAASRFDDNIKSSYLVEEIL